ncbi:MAG TPA: PKD domain-containing protein, partial [Thermoanaerobaculia bacterium]|nr:PKD domain-containing protein [Thermoanaerobaculia bacterium]
MAVLTLFAGSVSATGLGFSVQDVETGYLLAHDGAAFGAVSGQRLRFVPDGGRADRAWSFGDGTSSSEEQPIHAYAASFDTTYTVTLASGGETATASLWVAGADGSPLTGSYTYRYADGGAVSASSVAWNRAVRFTAADPADGYLWDFGDGTSATGSPADHSFTNVGTFRVKLTVTRGGTSRTTAAPAALTVLAPPERPLWVVPGIVFSDGLGGAFWQSDLTIVNPNAKEPMTLSMAFLDARQGTDTKGLRWSSLVLAPMQSSTFVNVLAGPPFLLPRGSFGALIVQGEVAATEPTIMARTYSGAAGTYGLSSGATSTNRGVRMDAGSGENLLVGLRETDTHYTNLALANLQPDEAVAEIRLYNAKGEPLGAPVRVDVPPFGLRQLTHVLSAPGPLGAGYAGTADGFSASITLLSGTALAPYATVIDSRSKDPVLVTPPAHVDSSYRLPGVVRASGRGGTIWRSDVVLANPSTSARRVNVSFSYQLASGGRNTVLKTLSLGPRETYTAVDFVKTWLGLTDGDDTNVVNGFVDVARAADDAVDEPLLLFGRTYNDQPGGEVGLGIPAFTTQSAASPAGTYRRLIVPGLKSNGAYRSNLALFLLPAGGTAAAASATANVDLFDRSGRLLSTKRLSLDSISSSVQWNDAELFEEARGTGEVDDVTAIVEVVSGAPVAAFATVIDQVSGDASF